MERETLERALHMWPQWDESIETSRMEWGYDPKWPAEKAIEWIQTNYLDKIQPKAQLELVRLDLPPNLKQYWEDCCYCDYKREDGTVDFSKIRRRIAYHEFDERGNKTGRLLQANKSLPEPPYQASLTWCPEEEIHSPWVRIEIMVHAPLASQDTLDDAITHAWRTLRQTRDFPHRLRSHPLEVDPKIRTGG